MAQKKYLISLPNGKKVRVLANSAQQAAKRVEKQHASGKHTVNQREFVSNVTRKSVADAPGIREAKSALTGTQVKGSVRTAKQRAASRRNLQQARKA